MRSELDGSVATVGVDERETELLARLREGDERAFVELVDGWSPAMLRVARDHVSSRQSAEDAVQDAWLAVVRGLADFEGRSTLRTWVFAILVNLANRRGAVEARTLPWSQVAPDNSLMPTVDPDRFQGREQEHPGRWTSAGAPAPWEGQPECRALAGEALALLAEALNDLPPRQRLVVSLRDVHGLSSEEACRVLNITPENQRVLLHRGRAGLRQVLEDYYRS